MLTWLGYFYLSIVDTCRYHAPAEERRPWWWTACPCTIFLWTGTKQSVRRREQNWRRTDWIFGGIRLLLNVHMIRHHQEIESRTRATSQMKVRMEFVLRSVIEPWGLELWTCKRKCQSPKVKAKPSWLDPPQMHVPVPKIAQKASESYASARSPKEGSSTIEAMPIRPTLGIRGVLLIHWIDPRPFLGLWARDSGHILLLPMTDPCMLL